MVDVFLSYSSQDLVRAKRVEGALTVAGYEVFWDQTTPPGVDWDTWIREKLSAARTVVVLWSKTSIASANVRHEAIIARDAGKLIPVLIDPLSPTDFPMGLYLVQGVKLDQWRGDAANREFQSLCAEIAARLGADRPPQPTPKEVSSPRENSRWLMLPIRGLLGVAAVIVIGAAIWVGWAFNQSAPSGPAQIADIEASVGSNPSVRAQSFEVRFPNGSFWLEAAADQIASRFLAMSGDLPERVIVKQTCRLQTDQQLEDDRSTAVSVAILRGGMPADRISVRTCDFAVVPAISPGAVRVDIVWGSAQHEADDVAQQVPRQGVGLPVLTSRLFGIWDWTSGSQCNAAQFRFRSEGEGLTWEAAGVVTPRGVQEGGPWRVQAAGQPELQNQRRVRIAVEDAWMGGSTWTFEVQGSRLIVWDMLAAPTEPSICEYSRR